MADPRQFVDLVNEILAHGFDDTKYRARVKNWVNEAQHRFLRSVQIAQDEAVQDITAVAGTAAYPLSSNVIRVRSVRNTTDHVELGQIGLRDYDEAPVSSGKPYSFAIAGTTLLLYPTPDAGYPIEVRYYQNAATLVNDTDALSVPDDYADVLISYALSRAYRAEEDIQMSQFYYAEFLRDLSQARADLQRLSAAAVERIPGMWGGASMSGFVRP